ncbi:MAG: glucose 1-dehydrogenase [Bacteroidetes bacterium]|nr:MAG: glucose 1-dehydrogenase [Bacteroidota bacterium]
MKFQDKVVLITGAASGIGRSTALAFARQGAKVVVSDVQTQGGQETVALINEMQQGEALFVPADVSNYEAVIGLIAATVEKFGRLDIAINNAGIGGSQLLKTAEHTLDDWERVIAVNQTGVFYCMKKELQQMVQQGQGCIVNIASMAGLKGLPNNLAYVASKHAVVGMTKTAALEYARHNIRINALCPVFTRSPMLDQLFAAKAGMEEQLKQVIPMKRYAQPEEMSSAILWLCSEDASFVTGHALPVDGGLSA